MAVFCSLVANSQTPQAPAAVLHRLLLRDLLALIVLS
jgi:hypothetical protein